MLFRFSHPRPSVQNIALQNQFRHRARIRQFISAVERILIQRRRVTIRATRRNLPAPPPAALDDDDIVRHIRPLDGSRIAHAVSIFERVNRAIAFRQSLRRSSSLIFSPLTTTRIRSSKQSACIRNRFKSNASETKWVLSNRLRAAFACSLLKTESGRSKRL